MRAQLWLFQSAVAHELFSDVIAVVGIAALISVSKRCRA